MPQNSQSRESTHTHQLARVATVLVALGALGLSLVVAETAGAATGVVVSTNKTAKQGTYLVSGKTLYTLKPSRTRCGTSCQKIWPPLMLPTGVTTATAGSGVNAAKLGTVTRSGRALQVTYDGKPLYYFFKDTSAGKVTGNITDKWGKWSVVVLQATSGSGSRLRLGFGGLQRGHRGRILLAESTRRPWPCHQFSSPPPGPPSPRLPNAPVAPLSRAWGRLTARVYLPACSIAGVAVVLVAIGWADHWGGSAFGGSLTMLRLVLIGPLTLVILGVLMVIERIWPAQRRALFAPWPPS